MTQEEHIGIYARIYRAFERGKTMYELFPSEISVSKTCYIASLMSMFGYAPTFVNPTSEASLVIEYFFPDDSRITFECCDDGEVVLVERYKSEFAETFLPNFVDEVKSKVSFDKS